MPYIILKHSEDGFPLSGVPVLQGDTHIKLGNSQVDINQVADTLTIKTTRTNDVIIICFGDYKDMSLFGVRTSGIDQVVFTPHDSDQKVLKVYDCYEREISLEWINEA